MDGLHLQQLLGHADIATTTRYVREHPGKLRDLHTRIWKGADELAGMAEDGDLN